MSKQSESTHSINPISMPAVTTGDPETFQWTLETLRSRVLYKVMDAVLTAPLYPRQTFGKYLRTVLSNNASNSQRVALTINLADQLVPGISFRMSNSLISAAHIPFAARRILLMGFGSGSTVFLLDAPGGLKVLKVFRRSLGKRNKRLSAIAGEFHRKYQIVSDWFRHENFQIVPPAVFLILQGPMLGKPAAATLQPFIIGEKRDLFQDFQDDELLNLCWGNPKLKEQVTFLAEKIIEVAKTELLCVDFVGRNNVVLVRDHTGCRISVIDNGIFNLERIQSTKPIVYSQVMAKIERLRRISLELKAK